METKRAPTYTIAAIHWQGPCTYALMTSAAIALPVQGWNNIAYPVAGSRPVGRALASIDGRYNVVFGYDPGDQRDPWKVYAPAPGWVSDLTDLTFGRGYWIYTTQPDFTLLLNGNGLLAAQAARPADAAINTPPAVIYGAVPGGNGIVPAAGQTVEARIDRSVCGQGTTRLYR